MSTTIAKTMAAQESAQANQLHVIFFPLMAQGHMIPLFDVARLFSGRGVKSTLITTPANASAFTKSDDVELQIIKFPSEEVGLPAGLENVNQITDIDKSNKFIEALKLMAEGPLKKLLLELRPNCLVSDMFLPWCADVAARAGIPWITFHGGGYFAMSVSSAIRKFRPQWGVGSDDEEFVLPELPGAEVRLSRKKLHPTWTTKEEEKSVHAKVAEWAFQVAEEKSFGMIMNSFYELEKDYAEDYQKVTGRRCWSIGPLSLCYRNAEENATRGDEASVELHECLRWLDSKPLNSVIYVCFGSIAHLSSAQLREIAMALEASGQDFIWVVRKPKDENKVDEEEWLPSGFEVKNHGKGLIIRGWVPQVLILDHEAVGGFLTHCGWNSTLEGVSAGLPMATWPMFAEQFMNEMLVTDVLRVGVSVGAKRNYDLMIPEVEVGKAAIEMAVMRVMVGEEAEEMRRRALILKELAWKAVREGGSSYGDLGELLKELSFCLYLRLTIKNEFIISCTLILLFLPVV